jgi:hypothetical protein
MAISIVDVQEQNCDVFIGRKKNKKYHFGNPFSHIPNANAIIMNSREDSVAAFALWITGYGYTDIEQDRRKWILDNLQSLEEQSLGCFCAPLLCHGEVLKDIVEEQSFNDVAEKYSQYSIKDN